MPNLTAKLRNQFGKLVETHRKMAEGLDSAAPETLHNSNTSLQTETDAFKAELKESLPKAFITLPDRRIIFAPEYEDLREFCAANNLDIKEVLRNPDTCIEGEQFTSLYLYNCGPADFSSFAGFGKLSELFLDLSKVDVAQIAAIPGLTYLDLCRCTLTSQQPCNGLSHVTILKARDSGLDRIDFVASFNSLKQLSLVNNRISDVLPLAQLTQLEILYLNDNCISDLASLSGLTNLRTLYLSDNPVSDISPLLHLPHLKILSISNNLFSDESRMVLDMLQKKGITVIETLSPLISEIIP